MSTLENYNEVKGRIAEAAKSAGRQPADVCLSAVTKTMDRSRIEPLLDAGHRDFAENRVQEAQDKWPDLKQTYQQIRLRLIGSLQTNKSKDAVALFDVIETVDREKLAQSLSKAMVSLNRHPDIFIQVNTGEEEQKGGITPKDAESFVKWAKADLGLPVVGLMCIPPADQPPAPHFALLYEMAQRLKLPQLSMGMSGDFDIAAQLGATHVRVGSALFGARPPLG